MSMRDHAEVWACVEAEAEQGCCTSRLTDHLSGARAVGFFDGGAAAVRELELHGREVFLGNLQALHKEFAKPT
jgi:hypothetical protein